MHDDTKAARELREEQAANGTVKDDAFTRFWIEVDEMMCSCLVMMTICKSSYKNPLLEEALQAANEALEFRPNHTPALYRRSQVHEKMELYGEAVADARAAYRYASEEVKFDMWVHRKHAIAERRANTLWWGFWGSVGDLPANIVRFPQTFAAMSQARQFLLILCVSVTIGLYRTPPEVYSVVFRGILGGGATADASAAAMQEPSPPTDTVGDATVANATEGVVAEAAALAQEAASGLATAAAAATTKAAAAMKTVDGKGKTKGGFWRKVLRAIGIGRGKKGTKGVPAATAAPTAAAQAIEAPAAAAVATDGSAPSSGAPSDGSDFEIVDADTEDTAEAADGSATDGEW
jgi:hypothetical protein